MKASLKLTTFILVLLGFSALILPNNFYHFFLDRDPSIDKRFETTINDRDPDLVFVGNSILKKAVDFQQLDELMESGVVDASVNGTTAPDWYLFLKNNIATSSKRPLTVVIFFTDYRLTNIPGLRGEGVEKRISKFAGSNEPIFDSLVYDLGYFERTALDLFAPYAYQSNIRELIEDPIKYAIPRLVYGSEREEIETSVEVVFSNDNMDPELLQIAIDQSEVFGQDQILDSFTELINSSFLPHIIEVANENGIDLIFARIVTENYLDPSAQPPELVRYMQYLENFLLANNAQFVDFTGQVDGLTSEGYRDVDHLNDLGRPFFTQAAAEIFRQLGFQ